MTAWPSHARNHVKATSYTMVRVDEAVEYGFVRVPVAVLESGKVLPERVL